MKKILFYSSTKDLAVGSYRIWVRDLSFYIQEQLGIDCDIVHTVPKNLNDYNIVICGKGDESVAVSLKVKFPSVRVGVINLACNKRNLPIDFVIVGSVEEKTSLSCYDNVFLFPLIERLYEQESICIHRKKDCLRIGFHGHYPHLNKFSPHLKEALEEFDRNYDMELLVVTSNNSFQWFSGKPNIKKLIIKKWDMKEVKQDLLTCDIGVVPNITCLGARDVGKTQPELGLYDTDYVLRMKNKSNAGRCFVFHQLGIPIVADLTPSNLHILGDPDCGFIANDKEGWYKALVKLTNEDVRNKVSLTAFREFQRLYHPYRWAERLYQQIMEIE